MPPIHDRERLLAVLCQLHDTIRDAVVAHTEAAAQTDAEAGLAAVVEDDAAGDTLFALDRIGDEQLIDFFAREVAPTWPLVLVAEGLPPSEAGEGTCVLPHGARPEEAEIRVLVDPIDGTRGLMYQKRSAWILTAVAPNQGSATRLRDAEIAVQTEIPLVKQHLSDRLWALRGAGYAAERYNRLTGQAAPLRLRPSTATTLDQGFVTFDRFFPGMRTELAAIDEEVAQAVQGAPRPGKALSFEDQYICSGGQFYELIAGHDRFIADLRPLAETLPTRRRQAPGACCHPYDVCTALIAEEAGVLLTDATGAPLDAPWDLASTVAWVGYANPRLRALVEPHLLDALRARDLLP